MRRAARAALRGTSVLTGLALVLAGSPAGAQPSTGDTAPAAPAVQPLTAPAGDPVDDAEPQTAVEAAEEHTSADAGDALPPRTPVEDQPEALAERGMLSAAPTERTGGPRPKGGRTPAPRPRVLVLPAPEITGYRTSGITVKAVPDGYRPYQGVDPAAVAPGGPVDAQGVRMFAVGSQLYDHPVAQAAYGLDLLEAYRQTGNPEQLRLAVAQADRLVERRASAAGRDGQAWFYPYPFDFALHGYHHETLRAPWFSGMAQGQALSLFVRLAEVTKDVRWQTAADATAESLTLPPSSRRAWVSHVDADGWLWLEEYPVPDPAASDLTFNGHVFAVFGLQDYLRLRPRSPRAATLFDGAAANSLRVAGAIRAPGWVSQYCLRHPEVRSTKYHGIHQWQLLALHEATGRTGFARLADQLRDDYPTAPVDGTVRLARGTHTGYRFDGAGRVTAQRTLVLGADSTAPADARQRVRGKEVHLRISAGALAGYWVPEKNGTAHLRGATGRHDVLRTRTASLAAGSHTGYRYSSTGGVQGSRTLTLGSTSTAPVRATAWINGRPHALVSAGTLADHWVPLSTQVTVR